ncbi:MAG: hypothetical protein ACSHW1_18455 [Yoonia sp.]|uniref:hypothetical protein n=1 Tax=Yoonia sp. TaxID=2212373 RepID=UPI003EF2BB4E
MSHRLSTAITLNDYASSILRQTKHFEREPFLQDVSIEERSHIGVEPMLLAFAMELALKAWFVFDYDDPEIKKTHNLLKLFEALLPESQERLKMEFKKSVVPDQGAGWFVEYSLTDILDHHSNAFVEWRYIHERKGTIGFNQSTFIATLEMIIAAFRTRYTTERY